MRSSDNRIRWRDSGAAVSSLERRRPPPVRFSRITIMRLAIDPELVRSEASEEQTTTSHLILRQLKSVQQTLSQLHSDGRVVNTTAS